MHYIRCRKASPVSIKDLARTDPYELSFEIRFLQGRAQLSQIGRTTEDKLIVSCATAAAFKRKLSSIDLSRFIIL